MGEELYPTHFSRGSKKFLGGLRSSSAPLVTGLIRSVFINRVEIAPQRTMGAISVFREGCYAG